MEQALADLVELACRSVFAYLGVPEQSDAYWAEIHEDFLEDLGLWLTAQAVMADAATFLVPQEAPCSTSPC